MAASSMPLEEARELMSLREQVEVVREWKSGGRVVISVVGIAQSWSSQGDAAEIGVIMLKSGGLADL